VRTTTTVTLALGIAAGLAISVAVVLVRGHAALLPAIQTLGSIAIAFSAIVAFSVYLTNVRRHQAEDARRASETYLNQSLDLLDKVHSTFIQKGTDPPANDRLLWLSTARMIARFQKLRHRITESDHFAVVDENEEHTRLKLYTLLDDNQEHFTRGYFSPSGSQYAGDNIHRRSMAVIFAFARWKEGAPDPLAEVDDVELFARGALPIDQSGAESYLEDFEEYWAKVQARKAEIDAEKT